MNPTGVLRKLESLNNLNSSRVSVSFLTLSISHAHLMHPTANKPIAEKESAAETDSAAYASTSAGAAANEVSMTSHAINIPVSESGAAGKRTRRLLGGATGGGAGAAPAITMSSSEDWSTGGVVNILWKRKFEPILSQNGYGILKFCYKLRKDGPSMYY